MAVVRNSLEEGADADAWVDTGVDEDDLSVVLNSPECEVFA